MSKEQIKNEINRILDHMPDKALEGLLSVLKNVYLNSDISFLDHASLENILTHDKELLKKLT
jgi:hypothetical protein